MSDVATMTHLLESLKNKGLVLLPIETYRELSRRPGGPFPEVQTMWERLTATPAVEAVMARRAGNQYAIWTVVDRVDEQTREFIYWQEWALMEQYPDLNFDFHLLERHSRPLETLITITDIDLFMRREAGYAL